MRTYRIQLLINSSDGQQIQWKKQKQKSACLLLLSDFQTVSLTHLLHAKSSKSGNKYVIY